MDEEPAAMLNDALLAESVIADAAAVTSSVTGIFSGLAPAPGTITVTKPE
jgi:hypothetical protein